VRALEASLPWTPEGVATKNAMAKTMRRRINCSKKGKRFERFNEILDERHRVIAI